jgi:hypothetical protein
MEVEMRVVSILSIILIFCSCQKNTTDPMLTIPTTEILESFISYRVVQRDSFIVYPNENARFHAQHFTHISIMKRSQSGDLTPLDTIPITYTKQNDLFLMDFQFGYKTVDKFADSEYLLQLDLRFYLNDTDFRSVQIDIELYKYPYSGSELILDVDDIACNQGDKFFYICDFDFTGKSAYAVPRTPGRLIGIDFTTHICREIYPFQTFVSHVCYYNGFIYTDKCHDRVVKMDANSYVEVAEIGQSIINPAGDPDFCSGDWYVQALDFDNGILYVLHDDPDNSQSGWHISFFKEEGTYIKTIPFRQVHYMAVDGGIVYWGYYDSDFIGRYDIRNGVDLTELSAPDQLIDAIKIANGRLYYTDYYRRIICGLPLDSLVEKT